MSHRWLWLWVPALTLAVLVLAPLVALTIGVSPGALVEAIRDEEILAAIGVSIGCAGVSVLLGLGLGVPAGYVLARYPSRRTKWLQALLSLPVVIPHPIVGVGLLLVFSRNQLVGAALSDYLGVRVASSWLGISLAMLIVSCPYIVHAARQGFLAVPARFDRTARSLGASSWQVMRTIYIPLAGPNIRSGAVLAWARSVSEFGSIVILAYYPKTAPVVIWDRFSAYGLEAALAPALLLLGVCLIIFGILQLLSPADHPLKESGR